MERPIQDAWPVDHGARAPAGRSSASVAASAQTSQLGIDVSGQRQLRFGPLNICTSQTCIGCQNGARSTTKLKPTKA
eukprot:s1099_g23.t1